jgi:hypothetical protein
VTNQAYLFKHVIFDEDSFPAKDQATAQLPSKINAQGDASLFLPISLPFECPLSVEPNSNTGATSLEQSPFATLHANTNKPFPSSLDPQATTNPIEQPMSPEATSATTSSPIPPTTSPIPTTSSHITHQVIPW